MEASTGAEGDATIGDRTEHFCREVQGGGGLRQRLSFVPASKGERDGRKADGGTAQRACRQQDSCLRFVIFPLSMRAYDTAASIASAVSASDRQCLPRAGSKAARKATGGRRHQASPTEWARTAGRTQPVRDRLNQQPPLYCRVRC
jgi:hypothetical protein